jgi:undecaprenyl-diphosphatase
MQTANAHNNPATKQVVAGLLTLVGLLMLVIWIGNTVDGGVVSALEKNVFIFINHWPNIFKYSMILVQYLGLLVVPAIAAGIALLYKKYVLAILFMLIIPAKILAEKIVKANFQRERPKVYIEEAILRGDVQASGLSFTSGHAIIIFAIVTLASPFVSRKIRYVLWTLAVLCIVARVYLGAHLPLDVIGGALIGISMGLVLLLFYTGINKLLIHYRIKKLEKSD